MGNSQGKADQARILCGRGVSLAFLQSLRADFVRGTCEWAPQVVGLATVTVKYKHFLVGDSLIVLRGSSSSEENQTFVKVVC